MLLHFPNSFETKCFAKQFSELNKHTKFEYTAAFVFKYFIVGILAIKVCSLHLKYLFFICLTRLKWSISVAKKAEFNFLFSRKTSLSQKMRCRSHVI